MYTKFVYVLCIFIFLAIPYADCSDNYRADKDLLIVNSYAEECTSLYQQYLAVNATADEKIRNANLINGALFNLWLLYFGPWKYDISGDQSANKYIKNIKLKYREVANSAAKTNDPLSVLDRFDNSKGGLSEYYHEGTFPNLNVEEIKTKQDYVNLVIAYHKWLDDK